MAISSRPGAKAAQSKECRARAPLEAGVAGAGVGGAREGLDGADWADEAEDMSTRRTESVCRIDGKRSSAVRLMQKICDTCEVLSVSRGEEAPCCDI